MSFLHALQTLLGEHQQAQQAPAQQQNPTKIPYDNGFYAGPHQQAPQQQLPTHVSQMGPLQNYNNGLDGGMAMGTPQNQDAVQGSQYNPGLIPLQGSYPTLPSTPGQATPQFGAFNGPQNLGHFNPQVRNNGFYYNQ